jgi:hypothetical protein
MCSIFSSAACLDEEGRCTKGFPQKFSLHTELKERGYTVYRRRKAPDEEEEVLVEERGDDAQLRRRPPLPDGNQTRRYY